MIVYDTSELKTNSKTITNDSTLSADWIEAQTGADVIVTATDDMPLVEGTLALHIKAGALLIQIKHESDLTTSFGTRMNEALARMTTTGARQWQKVLIPVGHYCRNPEDGSTLIGSEKPTSKKPYINWYKPQPSPNWRAYQTALRRWALRGGIVVESCKTPADLALWLNDAERDLRNMHPTKQVWAEIPTLVTIDENDPLQALVPVKDWRVMIAAAPGIGPKRVEALMEALQEHGLQPTGSVALEWITSSPLRKEPFSVKGWGKVTKENFRKFLGLNFPELILTTMWIDAEAAQEADSNDSGTGNNTD